MSYSFDIDEGNINEEFCQAPGLVAYFGSQLSQAKVDRELAKLNLDKVLASAHLFVREETRSHTPKLTVSDVDARVQLRTDVNDARMSLIEAEAAYDLAKHNFSAALTKKDMLVSLGANLRAEMDSTKVQINSNFVR